MSRERLAAVEERIAAAARRAGRSRDSITLVAVTKKFPAEVTREAYELGLRCFGENYVQEFERKQPLLADLPDAEFHLIGHLQSNKARIIERGLVKDGRLVRLRVPLPDHPGGLQRLTSVVAQQRANVVTVTHDRAYFGVHLGDTIIDITMETRGPDHIEDLMNKLTEAGYEFERVQ